MKLLLAFAAMLLIAGCASAPVKSVAIHNSLVTDQAIRIAVEQCRPFGGETRRLAERTQLDWWRRNDKWVLAADYGLLSLNWDDFREKSEPQRALNGVALLENIQADGQIMAQDWLGNEASVRSCDRLFTKIADGDFELTAKSSYRNVLEELDRNRGDLTGDAAKVRSINTRYRKYGRSLFNAEKVLKEAGCSTPTIALLRNSWPLEVYDAVCSGNDYLLVKCEWGRCEVKR